MSCPCDCLSLVLQSHSSEDDHHHRSLSRSRYASKGIDVFIDPLPGCPDNVRVAPRQGKQGIVVVVDHGDEYDDDDAYGNECD